MSHDIAIVSKRIRHARSGFTLVEILIVVIILGILAAIVIPQFAHASDDARKADLRSQLQTMRAAIQLYRVQHLDQTPDLVGSDWAAFTAKTDAYGNPSVNSNDWGPYLQSEPQNPLTGTSTISDTPAAGVGWVYTKYNGTIVATGDASGTLFDESTN
jgi:general secretion pathway protein G